MSTAPAAETVPFKKSVGREYLESIVVAVILALFIRTFVVQAFKIPTGSMETNLLIGDHLLVNKIVYSPSMAGLEERLLGKRPVQRGHVVVFKFPEDPSRDFIKRVIGLPGETVEIRNKTVFIDGKALDESAYVHFLEPPLKPGDPEYGLRGEGLRDNWGPQVVPSGNLPSETPLSCWPKVMPSSNAPPALKIHIDSPIAASLKFVWLEPLEVLLSALYC